MKIFNDINFYIDKKYLILLICLLIFGIFVTIIETLGMGVIGLFVMVLTDSETLISKIPFENIKNFLNTKSQISLIIYSSIFVTFVFIFKNIITVFYNYFELNLKRLIVTYNRSRLYNSYLNTDYIFFLKNNPSKLINNILSVVNLSSHYLFLLVRSFKDIILLIFLLSTLFFVNTKISLIIFGLMTLISVIIYSLIKKKIKFLGKEAISLEADLLKNLNHGIGSIKITKILGNFDFFMKKFLIVNEKRLKNEVLNGFLQMIPRLFLEVLAVLSLSLTILFFYIEGNSIKSILPTITLMTVIIIRMLPVFVNLNAGFNNLKYFRSGFDALKNEYINLDKNNQTYQNEENYFDKNKFAEINKININNVNFRYSKNEEKILKNISIQVNKGEFIGIIGKSGAGKSTLIDIILGLLKPEEGKILVNEKNIDLNYKEWQKNIGYVPQDVYLLDDTIKRNIALGKEDKEIDEKKLYSAVELSQLKEFVEDLPDKSNTIMGDRGARISGGQNKELELHELCIITPR